jgi:hypothetical protein
MLDPVQVLAALVPAGLTAAVVILIYGWPWRKPFAPGVSAGAVQGVGVGVYVGILLLGLRPNWPPREDQDRLLLLLFPAVVVIEFAAAFASRLRWLAWVPRLVVAALAARILLHGIVYLTEPTGTDDPKWTPAEAYWILGRLAAALAGVWALLVLLMKRSPGRSVPLAVAVACAGAAVTVMLSGYATAGPTGLALAASLIGMVAASLVLKNALDLRGVVGLGVVGLFGVLVAGRFFGELTSINARLLFLGLLLAWLPELPYVCRLWPWLRGVLRVVLVLVPVLIAVTPLAYAKYQEMSNPPSGTQDASDPYR